MLAQTLRHESSTTIQSHYIYWKSAIDNYNLGDYLESRVGSPEDTSFDSNTLSGMTSIGTFRSRAFHAKPAGELPIPETDYNVAPTIYQPIIRESRDTGEREIVLARWA